MADSNKVKFLISEFIRVLGLLQVVIGRKEYLTAVMAFADDWLQHNVNRPQDWYSKGLWVPERTKPGPYMDNGVPTDDGTYAPEQRTDKKPDPYQRTNGNTSILGRQKEDEEDRKDCGCHVGPYDKMKKVIRPFADRDTNGTT